MKDCFTLRTLSPEDPEFHPSYGGEQRERDMAYHQGTIWPYPLGAYYLAWLKVHGDTPQAATQVREQLGTMEAMLREGCVGQLPEIYDGGEPGPTTRRSCSGDSMVKGMVSAQIWLHRSCSSAPVPEMTSFR